MIGKDVHGEKRRAMLKKKMGRPKGSRKKNKLDLVYLQVGITKERKKILEVLAKEEGQTVNTYVSLAIAQAIKNVKRGEIE